MRRSLSRLFAAAIVGAAFAALPAAAASADSAPTIESESASHVSALDATLEASINPQDAAHGVYYQFQLLSGAGEYLPEFECPTGGFPAGGSLCLGLHSDPGALPIGYVHGGSQSEAVHLDLLAAGAKLRPGVTYSFRLIAARAILTEDTIAWEEPIVYGPQETFTTPPAAEPVIDSAAVSHVTATDATLEAQVDTEGLPTIYDFELSSSPCSHHGSGCELMIPVPLLPGLLLGSFVDQSVSVDLNSAGVTLGEGEYSFSVRATNALGSVSSAAQTFEAASGGALDPTPPASHAQGTGQPSTAPAPSQPIEAHPSGSTPPASSPPAAATPAVPLGTGAGSAGKHGAHKAKTKQHHHKPSKHPRHSAHKH